ncbi:MAG: enoyl-CoA hydratase/isomerase family protein [Phenylobacterium sp.]|uniref:enoyl-CoA hydratase/isomerase family protein n=1 Tax=Phenylobacterium sp. TaxID=1871053 RepID=UPI0025CDFA16|nr:enoyl-CoA hydratase/isomerase family protein [Phenylobacterium sp.]MCA4916506.1 enoyl-CoA hydratase/isomerase family protein [Phenylobacterium sp.]
MSEEILVGRDGGLGRLTLNRPQALHALTTVMCSTCITALLEWKDDPAVEAVLIDHAGERGFCAGGDIRMLADSGASDGRLAREFFFIEYRLNHLLFSYPKPVIAVMDGITMGGGVGLSAPARFRIATERTTFAMPETGIGLFPDVGGGWFLPRLPGRIGLWLALTGARIKAADCLHAGLATHHVPSERLPELKARLAENPSDIEALLAQFHVDPGPTPLLAHRAELDAAFGQGSVEAILAALEAGSDWARAQALALRTKSPQTLKVAFRQLALGLAAPDFAANMAMEYRIGARVVQRHDFLEGVRAVIVDKDNAPRWDPATLEGVGEDLLDAIFAPLPADQEWSPLERTSQ